MIADLNHGLPSLQCDVIINNVPSEISKREAFTKTLTDSIELRRVQLFFLRTSIFLLHDADV